MMGPGFRRGNFSYAMGFVTAVIAMLMVPTSARAWGPGMHFYLTDQLLQFGLVGGTTGALLRDHRRWFYYGSVIADVVIGKGFISYEEHSHNWKLAHRLRDRAETDDEVAFALGIWTHLAADTVAHNEFVPEMIRRDRFPEKLGHAYWEFRAERWIPEHYWKELDLLIRENFEDHEELLEQTISRTLMPFPVNWTVLKSHLKLSTWKSWRRLSDTYARMSKHDLDDAEMDHYVDLCLDRMADSLGNDERRDRVLDMDPTGDFPEHHDTPEVE